MAVIGFIQTNNDLRLDMKCKLFDLTLHKIQSNSNQIVADKCRQVISSQDYWTYEILTCQVK